MKGKADIYPPVQLMNTKNKILSVFLTITFLFQILCVMSYADILYPKGDADLNYEITVDDARQLLRFALKKDGYTQAHVKICDFDNDGSITTNDTRTLLRCVIGMEELSGKVSVGDSDFAEWIYKSNVDPNSFETVIPEQPTVKNKQSGTFIFYVYGYGHGLGMSQYGAVAFSRAGCKYSDILKHYFTGTTLVKSTYPKYTLYCGEKIKTKELIARIVYQEIYGIATEEKSVEALKAQAVCVYTILKLNNFEVYSKWTAGVASSLSYSELPNSLKTACNSVSGYYLTLAGDETKKPISSVYTASVGGATASSDYIWGSHNSYLQSVSSPLDLMYSSAMSVKIFTKSQMQSLLSDYNVSSIKNPSKWITILDHTCSIDQSRGYVTCIKVGNTFVSDEDVYTLFYEKLGLRSTCFTVEYVS